jgi:CelD/BcsL family acetyltransferase involved in cellulose biosynthesis
VLDRGEGFGQKWDAPGLLVLNLPVDAAAVWESVRAPDSRVRFDSAYAKRIGPAPDGVLGDIGSHDRTEWRRRWRRAGEKGVRLVEETEPSDSHIDEVVALTNASAVRHGWPELYDRTTAREVLGVPGGRLLRAVWLDRTIGGFVALEHDRRLYLWAGGIDHTVLREVSPYLFVLYELLSTGADRGWDLIEFGKGNDDFKRKHGFVATELWSLWYAATPEEAAIHAPRLASLHDRLTSLQGD